MRTVLIAVYAVAAYYALRAVLRWLLKTPPRMDRREAGGPPDGEMVLDPECGAYVLKDRAVTRIVRGSVLCFCSEVCAAAHEDRGGPR